MRDRLLPTGSDDVLDAAFRRSGVLRVTDIGDVFHLAEVLVELTRSGGRFRYAACFTE
jgi:acetyltransferase